MGSPRNKKETPEEQVITGSPRHPVTLHLINAMQNHENHEDDTADTQRVLEEDTSVLEEKHSADADLDAVAVEYIVPITFTNSKDPEKNYAIKISPELFDDPKLTQEHYKELRDLKTKKEANGGKLTEDDIRDVQYIIIGNGKGGTLSTEEQLDYLNNSNFLDATARKIEERFPEFPKAYASQPDKAIEFPKQEGVELQDLSGRNAFAERNKQASMDQPFKGANLNVSRLLEAKKDTTPAPSGEIELKDLSSPKL